MPNLIRLSHGKLGITSGSNRTFRGPIAVHKGTTMLLPSRHNGIPWSLAHQDQRLYERQVRGVEEARDRVRHSQAW
jgi:hypothetical protein